MFYCVLSEAEEGKGFCRHVCFFTKTSSSGYVDTIIYTNGEFSSWSDTGTILFGYRGRISVATILDVTDY